MVGKLKMTRHKQLWWTTLSIVIITPIGFYSKLYSGPLANWVNDSLGGIFYEIFWCLLIFLFFFRTKAWHIAATVFIITSMLEFLQLWHPSVLEWIRDNFIGRTILGTSFTWSDFPYYALGSGIGWLWISFIIRKTD